VRRCDGFVLTGGDDPRTEPFGEPTHPQACLIHPLRQEYETELLRALLIAGKPVLGICLGMQMMALVAGGRINQHMPDSVSTARDHRAEDAQRTGRDAMHAIVPDLGAPACPATRLLSAATGGSGPPHVASRHHQAVSDPGSLRVIARAHDGVIEAVTDPSRPYYIGVQWHPERTEHPALGLDLFRALVQAASGARPGAAPA
jgi:putative glutamine amidotransferase